MSAASRLTGVALGLAAGLAISRRGWPLQRFQVADASMQPTLQPGDRLFIRRATWDRAPRTGDVVVAHDPEQPGRALVKRVASVAPDGRHLILLGDHRAASRDSRAFGPLPRTAVVGRAVWRYLPGARRGRFST